MKGFKQGAQTGTGVEAHGRTMGFAKGGQVKSSPQFKLKTEAQDSMDTGVQPARRGRNQAEVEAGGTKRMRPGFADGGEVKATNNAERRILNNLRANTAGQPTKKAELAALEAYRHRQSGARGLGTRSSRELEAMGEKRGGQIKKASGGAASRSHNSTPMYGKYGK